MARKKSRVPAEPAPKPLSFGQVHRAAARTETNVRTQSILTAVLIEHRPDQEGNEHAWAVATDGYILARRKVPMASATPGLLPSSALLAATIKGTTLDATDTTITLTNERWGYSLVYQRPNSDTFAGLRWPPTEDILVPMREKAKQATALRVCFDAQMLARMAEAIRDAYDEHGKTIVTLHIPEGHKPLDPLYFTTEGGNEGMVMPVRA